MEFRDWFVVGFIAAAFSAATTYLFMHQDSSNFVTWSSFVGGFGVAFHLVMTWDQKRPDAP